MNETRPMPVDWLAQEQRDVPEGSDWLAPGESVTAGGRPSPKRLSEARLRRWTAKRAVALHFGLAGGESALARVEIGHEAGGAPVALVDRHPAGVAVSLTDREGRAVCALAPPHVALGCDLERVEPRSPAFVVDFLTAGERRLVSTSAVADRPVLANLIWSAKESALKALGTGLRRDTRSVEVALHAGEAENGWRRLVVDAAEGHHLDGWWRRDGDLLLTVVADLPLAPPRALRAG